ncbi:hypothetical protein J3B02_004006, partial [Coemansia erecta]
TESGAFRVDVCGHQYSIPGDQMDAGYLDSQIWQLTRSFSQDTSDQASEIASKISSTIQDLVIQGPPPENIVAKTARRRTNGRRQSRRTDTMERRRLAAAMSRLGTGSSDILDDLQATFDLVSQELNIQAYSSRSFRLSVRTKLGDGIEEFVVSSSDINIGLIGVAAPLVDLERPFSTGLAEFLVSCMNRYARNLLNVRYLWALIVCPGRIRLCLVETDAIHIAKALDVGTCEGRDKLIELITNLGTAEPLKLGLDPSMRWRDDLDRWEIDCPDEETKEDRVFYAQKLPLFVADSFFGRFTRCFAVSDLPTGAVNAVLKDSWQLGYPGDSSVDEISVLRKIRDRLDKAKSNCMYPRISSGGTVYLRDMQMEDTSDVILGSISCYSRWTVPHGNGGGSALGLRRVHRRMVTGPIGVPLQSLESEQEVITVLADVMRSHSDILQYGGILHRDVSLNNVMAIRMPSGELRGMLIDYDHAIDPSSIRNQRCPGNIGTGPFMSISNLEGLDIARTAVDDWEALISLLFCLGAKSHQALEQMGTSFARIGSQGVANVKREMFCSMRSLEDTIDKYLDVSGCPNIIRLIKALYMAIFQHPKCQGTVQMMLRGNRMVDPVLRRVQYACDIQRRCLVALEAVAGEVRSMGRLSDHLATISHESASLCVTPPRNSRSQPLNMQYGSDSPSPTETVYEANAEDSDKAADQQQELELELEQEQERESDAVPLSAKSDVISNKQEKDLQSAIASYGGVNDLEKFTKYASMYQHSTTTTLHETSSRGERNYIVVNDILLQAVARKRKAKEETQDSPRTKRRKMIHSDEQEHVDAYYSPVPIRSLGVYATPRSVPQQPTKYRVNSKLQ